MNELLAIIIIVVICCAMFFAWLFSMATCPDRMVNLLSGTTAQPTQSSSASSSASKELIASKSNANNNSGDPQGKGGARSSVSSFLQRLQTQKASNSNNSKKLSVVPEQDEQLTVTSISQLKQQQQMSIGRGNNAHQRSSILPQNANSACRLIMEEEFGKQNSKPNGRTIYLRQSKHNIPGRHQLLQNAHSNDDEDDMTEERCVEDVIMRRNRLRNYHLTKSDDEDEDEEKEGDGRNEIGETLSIPTADVTPVPSRTSTHPGSLLVLNQMHPNIEAGAPSCLNSTTTPNSAMLGGHGSATQGIIHVI